MTTLLLCVIFILIYLIFQNRFSVREATKRITEIYKCISSISNLYITDFSAIINRTCRWLVGKQSKVISAFLHNSGIVLLNKFQRMIWVAPATRIAISRDAPWQEQVSDAEVLYLEPAGKSSTILLAKT